MARFWKSSALLAVLLSAGGLAQRANPAGMPIKLFVDATRSGEKFLRAQMQIPVAPGPLTLVYPKWIPGEHGPTGPVTDLTGVEFFANGQRLAWRRDLSDMYAFDLTVPERTNVLEARLDLVMPAPPEGFSSGASATPQLNVLSWNQVLLYPKDRSSDDVLVTASLRLPGGWRYGTALKTANEKGSEVTFQPVSLNTLVDSPVLAGAHFRRIELTPGDEIPHYLDAAADSESALEIPPDTINHYKRLVAETGALFGARHYSAYHFLLTLSDYTAHFGLEHHESSDDRVAEHTMVDDDLRWLAGNLLSHEMTHSWNGKYRRPKGLATANYQQPMLGDLLWVYEGLTQYWGDVLAARSGLWTRQQFLDEAAETAAAMNHVPGRTWRPLQDTADAAQLLYNAAPQFESWRRGVDFYPEGFLLWLEVDSFIRLQTHGSKSLNDFARAFYGGQNTAPKVVPYTFADLVNALNQVAPYDWRKFFRDRLDSYGPDAPLRGVTNGGWRLVYDETPSDYTRVMEKAHQFVDARFSIGLALTDRGEISDVIANSPAWKAGVSPGSTLVAVNGRKFTPDTLREALKNAKGKGPKPELLVVNDDFYKTYVLDYHDGEKYAHLVRDETGPDVLGDIIQPLAKASGQQ